MAEITAIICTYNRAHVILNTLASLERQTLAPERFHVLVVDNNSTDNTVQVVRDFAQQSHLQVRYVFETEQGVARARNRGWQEAETELVAYIDDDARAEPDWLEQYLKAFAEVKPTPVCIAGKVELDWEGGRPAWFPERFESLLARYDFGDVPVWHRSSGYLVTCNVAFQRNVFDSVGGFNPELGNRGNESYWQGGEDNDMFNRLIGETARVYYLPTAVVWHLVPKDRQTKSYLRWRLYTNGSAQLVADSLNRGLSRREYISGIWSDTRMLATTLMEWSVSRVNGSINQVANAEYRIYQRAGRVRMGLRAVGLWK